MLHSPCPGDYNSNISIENTIKPRKQFKLIKQQIKK